MFGSGKIKELEARLSEMSGKLGTLTKEKENLQQELNRAREKVSSLEEKLKASESEALNRELKGSIAEYEGLKELYQRKNEEFDTSRKDREEEFARKAATPWLLQQHLQCRGRCAYHRFQGGIHDDHELLCA